MPVLGIIIGSLVYAFWQQQEKAVPGHTFPALQIQNTTDLCALGPLCRSLDFTTKAEQKIVIPTLIRLLGQVQLKDAEMLPLSPRIRLYRKFDLATAQEAPDLLITALGALQRIQDVNAIPYVQGLILNLRKRQNVAPVRDAAETCLQALLTANNERHASSMLLRASIQPVLQTDTLLRPAASTPEMHQEQLLRSSQAEPHD